ncbi:MAG: hypothetical protein P1R58_11810 [bacterium]|nr:hypothetical protein [bacterium]
MVVFFFRKPIDKIFARIIGEDLSSAWRKFILFALMVVGVSSGVNIWRLEQYISPAEGEAVKVLGPELWGLHIYSTVINTLGGLAWALFLFFVVALIAFVVVRKKEAKS